MPTKMQMAFPGAIVLDNGFAALATTEHWILRHRQPTTEQQVPPAVLERRAHGSASAAG